jgi:hypothetical protein
MEQNQHSEKLPAYTKKKKGILAFFTCSSRARLGRSQTRWGEGKVTCRVQLRAADGGAGCSAEARSVAARSARSGGRRGEKTEGGAVRRHGEAAPTLREMVDLGLGTRALMTGIFSVLASYVWIPRCIDGCFRPIYHSRTRPINFSIPTSHNEQPFVSAVTGTRGDAK